MEIRSNWTNDNGKLKIFHKKWFFWGGGRILCRKTWIFLSENGKNERRRKFVMSKNKSNGIVIEFSVHFGPFDAHAFTVGYRFGYR